MPDLTSTTSTSTTISPPPAIERKRTAVRRRTAKEQFTATPTFEARELLINGVATTVQPGMWIIARGSQVLEIITDPQFQRAYETADDRALTLGGPARASIEATLGFGSTVDADQLVAAIRRLASLKIGGIEVSFTPGQFDLIAHRASKRGLTTDVYLKQLVQILMTDLLAVI